MEKVEIIMRHAKQNEISETVLATFDIGQPSTSIQDKSILRFPGLSIHLKEHIVYRNDKLVLLTHKEFSTLVYLARHPKWIFTSEQIYSAVWNKSGKDCGAAVSNIIGQIRRKLTPDDPKGGYIRTVVGSGYKFEPS